MTDIKALITSEQQALDAKVQEVSGRNLREEFKGKPTVYNKFDLEYDSSLGSIRLDDYSGSVTIQKDCTIDLREDIQRYNIAPGCNVLFTGIAGHARINAPGANIFFAKDAVHSVNVKCANLYGNRLNNCTVEATGDVTVINIDRGKFDCANFHANTIAGSGVGITTSQKTTYKEIYSDAVSIKSKGGVTGGRAGCKKLLIESESPVIMGNIPNSSQINALNQPVCADRSDGQSTINCAGFHCNKKAYSDKVNDTNPPPPPYVPPPPPEVKRSASRIVVNDVTKDDAVIGKVISFPRAYTKLNSEINPLLAQIRETGGEMTIDKEGDDPDKEGDSPRIQVNTHRLANTTPMEKIIKSGVESALLAELRTAEARSANARERELS